MKKVILLLVMISLTLQNSFGAEKSGGQLLIEAGFIEGKPGSTIEEKVDSSSPLTREQLAVLVVELNGKTQEAVELQFNHSFLDSNQIGEWSIKAIQYSAAAEWMKGFPDGSFRPRGLVTGKQLAAVLLNILNYSFEYDSVLVTAGNLGLNISDKNMTRGEAFDAIWTAVSKVKINEEDTYLGEKLGKIYSTSSIKLEISSFFAPSSKYLEVEFSRPLSDEEREKTIITLNYFDFPLSVTEEWNSDNSVVRLYRESKTNLGFGNYVVKVKGIARDEVSLFTVVSTERPMYLKINSTKALPELNVKISTDVFNQYGELMSNIGIKPEFVNLTKESRTVTGTLSNLDFSRTEEGDIIMLSAHVITHPDVRASAFITVTKNYIRSLTFTKSGMTLPDISTVVLEDQRLAIEALYSDNTTGILTPTMRLDNKAIHDNFYVEYMGITNVGITEIGELDFDLNVKDSAYIKFINQSNGLIFEYDFSDFINK